MNIKCCSDTGNEEKTKLCVIKLFMKGGLWYRNILCMKKLCVNDGICESVSKREPVMKIFMKYVVW